jgi:hypothetical protein
VASGVLSCGREAPERWKPSLTHRLPRSSLGKLASRGVGLAVAEERDVDDERFFKGARASALRSTAFHPSKHQTLTRTALLTPVAGMMDGVRTTATPELSPEAIEAARQRRREVTKLDRSLDEEMRGASMPSNHPWATSKGRLSAEEEEAKRAEVMRRNATPRRSMQGEDAGAE